MRKKLVCGLLAVCIMMMHLCCVYAEGELRITTSSLPTGETGQDYTAQLVAIGGTAPYTFSLAKGRLPEGVVLEEDGTIHGMPRQSGNFVGLYFQVSDSTGASVTKKIKWKITSIPVDFTITENSYEYDGAEHRAVVTPSVAELTEDEDFVVTYGGKATQSNTGTYNISIIMQNLRYRVNNINGTYLVITTMPATLTASSKTVVYDGARHGIDVTAQPEDLPYTVTYRGRGETVYGPTSQPPFAIGTYVATVQPSRNYDVQDVTAYLTITDPHEDVIVDFTVKNQVQTYVPGQESQVYYPEVSSSLTDFAGYTVSYRRTDVAGAPPTETITEAGRYEIIISVTEKYHKLGKVSGDHNLGSVFVLNPYEVSFAVTNTRHVYDGERKKADITPSLEGFEDYTVTYGSDENASTEGQSELGIYDISIALTNPNFVLNAQPDKKLVIAEGLEPVNFTISDNVVTYQPQQAEYEATVTPSLEGFSSYTVQYQNESGVAVDKITTAGTYVILITITESGYAKGSVNEGGEHFQLLPMPVTFSVTNNERYATGANITAVITPPDGFEERYSVVYDNIATEAEEQDLAVKDVGEYRIHIRVDNPNYTATASPDIFRILAPIVLNYGNSPYGLIMRENWETAKKQQAKEEFAKNYRFADAYTPAQGNANIRYSPEAWGDSENLDLDDAAIFIYDLAQLQDPGCLAHYSDGSDVPPEAIRVELVGLKAMQKSGIDGLTQTLDLPAVRLDSQEMQEFAARMLCMGVYDLKYSFTDKVTQQQVSKTRRIVLLNRIGDANLDRNVNAVDGNFINGIAQEPTALDKLYLYRVCDVNKDGIVNAEDAKAVFERIAVPLIPHYQ